MSSVFGMVHLTTESGLLTLELDKPTYERVGLAGKPFPGGGQKHKKARYLIEINLRLPSMVPGKKAFNRVEWAFKRVLNHSLAWLFYDADQPSVNNENAEESPILKHHPFIETVKPTVERIRNAQIPKFIPSEGLEDQEYIAEIHEWLGLAFVNSPRISKDDIIDSYLSRYHPPIAQDADGKDIPLNVEDIVSVKWQGLIPSAFVEKLYMTVRKPAKDRWFALNASGFEEQGYSVINQGSEVLTWQWPAG
ncbi:MAG: hypothetical protein M1820_002377 [Bogoriella megaspora]|nr:MAG: hypothetical protein M1820_002377 [Bogoriella megaspora]